LARLLFDPPAASVPNGWLDRGDWAMFRLFGRGKLVPSANGEKSALSFQMAERQAAFTLQTGPRNPLTPGVLQGFRCPVVQ
jgi:type VI protein secretion system component VasK